MANGSNVPWPYMDAILYQCSIQNYSIVCAKRIENCGSEIKIKSFIVEPSHKTLNLRNINETIHPSVENRASASIRLNSSKHAQPPEAARPAFFHG